MNRLVYMPPPRAFIRPSGATDAPAVVGDARTIPMNEHEYNPTVHEMQRLLLGTGFSVGPQGADGRLWVNTANGIQSFKRWYNALPERPMASPTDLSRGNVLVVNRELNPATQTALRRFAARASDTLRSVDVTINPVQLPAPFPTGAVIAIGAGALVVGTLVGLALKNRKKKS